MNAGSRSHAQPCRTPRHVRGWNRQKALSVGRMVPGINEQQGGWEGQRLRLELGWEEGTVVRDW